MPELRQTSAKQNFVRKVSKILVLAFLAFMCFVLLSGILLCWAHLSRYGFDTENINIVGKFLWELIKDPLRVFYAYGSWHKTFVLASYNGSMEWEMLLPVMAPVVVVLITVLVMWRAFFANKWRFNLENHFALEKDVEKAGLFDGDLMCLGKWDEKELKLNKTYSVFAYGESGIGKTSGVAIPAILETDGASVVAIDDSGVFAKYTSGYRARLGKVFYFDWRLKDDPEKSEYWPRWNPLSPRNLPKGGVKREQYMVALVRSLLAQDRETSVENYWDRLGFAALHGLLRFFIAKVEQANANDYFLNKIAEKGSVFREDRELLLSYCISLPEKVSQPIIEKIKNNELCFDNYVPIGSWGGIAEEWQGREMCLPMFVDFIIQRYFLIMNKNKGKEADCWKILLEEFLEETAFFGYNPIVSKELRQLFYLSKKQRNIVFPIIMKPLMIFRNKIVRERTCLSDFYLRQIRGIKTSLGVWQVTTIYNVHNDDYMSRFFVDMLIEDSLLVHRSGGAFPVMFVMDDLAALPKYNALTDGIYAGLDFNLSFLLTAKNLDDVSKLYGFEKMESIIGGATYKIIAAENNQKMASALEEMAIYGTKSVQIPCVSNSVLRLKNGLADSSYYRRIAKGLDCDTENCFSRGDQMILAEGFYHRPIKTQMEYFMDNAEMREKAGLSPTYFVALDILKSRNQEDLSPPLLVDVLRNSGIKIQKGEEVDEFIDRNFAQAVEYSKMMPDKESALKDEILKRWEVKKIKKEEKPQVDETKSEKDWWMTEDCFAVLDDEKDQQ